MKTMTFWGREDTDERLLVECMSGLKTATCTPKVWMEEEEMSYVGDLFEVYTKLGELACLIEITEVYEIPFGDIKGEVGEKIAKGENSTLDEYIKDHIFTWEQPLNEQGYGFGKDTRIIVEHFRLVESYIDYRGIPAYEPRD
ncbi:ASCH domain-containing protein [Cytobacillus sp. FJAT-54145]|uniref:ASCH domain-containing protein n=1 Tax=Cytobacillus spartinae TaxID=3299023 RepID=A0ABW6KDL7_9BACI